MDIALRLFGFVTALIIVCVLMPLFIPFLRKLKFGQQIIEEYGPTWHKYKQGIPTMGGIVFIIATAAAFLAFGFSYYIKGESSTTAVIPSSGLTCLITSCMYALIGFIDDFIKIKKKHNLGLSESQKLILQFLVSAAFVMFTAIRTNGNTTVCIPFFGGNSIGGYVIDFGIFYYVLLMIVLVGFTNAVNLTDGVDGLATSVTIPVVIFFVFASSVVGASELMILSCVLAGACVGFLVFNWHPAKIFMGDVGSLFLGGMVATIAVSLNMPLILLVVGIIYVIEAFSVLIQRIYFKITKGKRLFRMTPIHHSFELSGWKEEKICLVFSAVTVIACVLAALWLLI